MRLDELLARKSPGMDHAYGYPWILVSMESLLEEDRLETPEPLESHEALSLNILEILML